MKKILFTALMIVISSTFCLALTNPLIKDLNIQEPEAGLPEAKWYGDSGIWDGKLNGPAPLLCEITLALERIEREKVIAVFHIYWYWGPPGIERVVGEYDSKGRINITFKSGSRLILTLQQPEKKIEVLYYRASGGTTDGLLIPRPK